MASRTGQDFIQSFFAFQSSARNNEAIAIIQFNRYHQLLHFTNNQDIGLFPLQFHSHRLFSCNIFSDYDILIITAKRNSIPVRLLCCQISIYRIFSLSIFCFRPALLLLFSPFQLISLPFLFRLMVFSPPVFSPGYIYMIKLFLSKTVTLHD